MRQEASPDNVVPQPRLSLGVEIAATLRERIFSGELRPGERIGELDVAQAFQSSQAPVREAFATLRSEGLLITLPWRGTFVSGISLADARAAYEVRRRLDAYVVEQSLDQITASDLKELDRIAEAMRQAAEDGDVEVMTRHDMELHGFLWRRCGSDVMARIWDLLAANVRKFIVVAGRETFGHELPEVAAMHRDLVELIRNRDVDGLQAELRRQLDLFWQRIDVADAPGEDAG